ncbi:hypothetical protein CKM354_000865000 [Cercospora kikuchii]|uniref:Uncharacterized protein n=1 Tax=Cercospora kikuchii TaxID=84275 RepID=A0A9P3CN76_9PEZI|nr:uncharacterized protein CKM354_000865000 [Cercospora kikuchii]GIZ45486.1 hypothetical protein CKM354_000865000 [Cercospora kikuchii]
MVVRKTQLSSVLLTLLVPVILICAFSLSIAGTAGKNWAQRIETDFDTGQCMGINHRGPFQYCVLNLKNISSTTTTATDESATPTPTESNEVVEETPTEGEETTTTESATESSTPTPVCPLPQAESRYEQFCNSTTRPGGACSVRGVASLATLGRNSATGDSSTFCQQLKLSGSLLLAGCALIGIGMLASLILSGITLLQIFGRYKAPDDASSPSLGAVAVFTSIVTGLGFLAMLFGTVVGANVLVNLQFPAGDWYTSGDLVNSTAVGPWMLGKSVSLATAGWILAAVGASLVGKIWPSPTAHYRHVSQDDVRAEVVRPRGKHDREE